MVVTYNMVGQNIQVNKIIYPPRQGYGGIFDGSLTNKVSLRADQSANNRSTSRIQIELKRRVLRLGGFML